MGGVVGTGIDAAGFFQVGAEIAGGGFLLDNGFLAAGIFEIVDTHIEGMKIDVAVRAVARTEAAANAPVFDDDFERVAAANGAHGAANHAERVATLPAGSGDEEVFEAEAVANETSDAIVGIGASVHAGIAAGALLKIEDQQALRLHQTLGEKLVNGNALEHLEALGVGGLAFGDHGLETRADIGEARNHIAEIFARNPDEFDVIEGGAGSGARAAAEEADFAEVVAAREIGEDEFPAGIVFGDFHEADAHQIEGVGGIALTGDDLAGCVTNEFDAVFEMVDEAGGELREHRHAAEMGFQGATAIILVELRAEGFVLHHDVEDIAQHFKGDDIGLGAHGGGARVEIHAGHFAEKIAGAEFGDGIAVGEIDGSVDGNGAIGSFFVALVFFTTDENAGEAFEKALGATVSFDVGDGRGDGHLGLAFDEVKRGGAEIAFAADDLAGAEAAFDDGAAVEFEEGAGHSGEDGHAVKLFCGEGLGGLVGGNRGTDGDFVGERAGGTGDHALAAGNAGGIAHGRVEIEGDAGGVAFAGAAENEIVFDFVAAADAAVAKNAGVVIDGDGEGRIVAAAGSSAARKTRTGDAGLPGESLEFAVAGMLLASAG